MRGPKTRATVAEMPADTEFFGIQFRLGTFTPHPPPAGRVDGDVVLPKAGAPSGWAAPPSRFRRFEEADLFVTRLERRALLVRDPIVAAVLAGREADVSSKTVRRRFVQTTGLTPKTVQQIERAERAAALLKQGRPVADAVYLAGYADQPHPPRSLKRFLGQTPAQLAGAKPSVVPFVQDGLLRPVEPVKVSHFGRTRQ